MSHRCPKGSTTAPWSRCVMGRGPVMECWCSLTGLRSTAPASDGTLVHGDGVVNEELDPHGRETDGGRTSCAVRRRLVREEEWGPVHRKSRDDFSATSQLPQHRGAECGLVELDGGVPIVNGQHGTDSRRHDRGLGNGGPPLIRTHVARMPGKQPMMAREVLDSVLPFAILGLMQFLDNPGTCRSSLSESAYPPRRRTR